MRKCEKSPFCVNWKPCGSTSLSTSPLLLFHTLLLRLSPSLLLIGQRWNQQRRETARGGGGSEGGRETELGYRRRTEVDTKKRCRCVESWISSAWQLLPGWSLICSSQSSAIREALRFWAWPSLPTTHRIQAPITAWSDAGSRGGARNVLNAKVTPGKQQLTHTDGGSAA